MTLRRIFLYFAATIVIAVPSYADKVAKDFKKALSNRYERKEVICIPGNILLGLDVSDTRRYDFRVVYTHFDESVSVPPQFSMQQRLDDRTYLQSDFPKATQQLPALQKLRSSQMSIGDDFVRLDLVWIIHSQPTGGGFTLSEAHGTSERTGQPRLYGATFVFKFPPQVIQSGDADTVIAAISKYFVPPSESQQALQAAIQQKEAAKKVEIHPGMTKEEVIKALGEPQKTIVFGKKTILKYADIIVELEDNKVTEVKAN